MKKSFSITDSKLNADRKLDAIKHEITKYIARERRKKLPEGSDYWDFDCKIGVNSSDAKAVHVDDLNKSIDSLIGKDAKDPEITDIYVEIQSKDSSRAKSKK